MEIRLDEGSNAKLLLSKKGIKIVNFFCRLMGMVSTSIFIVVDFRDLFNLFIPLDICVITFHSMGLVLALFFYVFLHEGLHLLVYPGGLLSASNYVIFGKNVVTAAHEGKVSRNRYLLVCIIPFLTFAVAFIIPLLIVPQQWRMYFLFLQFLNFSLSSSDILQFFLVIFKTKRTGTIYGPYYFE